MPAQAREQRVLLIPQLSKIPKKKPIISQFAFPDSVVVAALPDDDTVVDSVDLEDFVATPWGVSSSEAFTSRKW